MTTMQIEEARRALEELTTDEAELARLHAEQTDGIQALKDGGSRDFGLLANLEGKRSALSTMLTEQRGHIINARAYLVALETAQIRTGHLEQLRLKVANLLKRREETDALVLELATLLAEQITKITAARGAWLADLEEAQEEARILYALPRLNQININSSSRADWFEAFAEIGLRAQEALTYSPVSTFVSGLEQSYSRPQAVPGSQLEMAANYAAQAKLTAYLDRPVMLTIAQVLEEQNRKTPYQFSGGDR